MSQLKENKSIFIMTNKKRGASCITTHLLFVVLLLVIDEIFM